MKSNLLVRVLVLIAGTLLLQVSAVEARDKKTSRFHMVLDYHFNLGFGENHNGTPLRRSDGYNMRGNSLHLTALYDITKRISFGAGIGADRYEEPGYNTIPVFGTFRYRPFRTFLDAYTYTNLGYGLFGGENSSSYSGWMWDAGVGYNLMFRRHFGLNFQVGYNLKEFRDVYSDADGNLSGNSIRHSLSLGFGLVF